MAMWLFREWLVGLWLGGWADAADWDTGGGRIGIGAECGDLLFVVCWWSFLCFYACVCDE
jgi:hypothetical protein